MNLNNLSPLKLILLLCGLIFIAGCLLTLTSCSEQSAPAPSLSKEQQLQQLGMEKSRMCVGCHGPKGISRVASYPSIAGKSAEYISAQLYAFRKGERTNPMMSSIAMNISEEDIPALSQYYSSLPGPEVQADLSPEAPQ